MTDNTNTYEPSADEYRTAAKVLKTHGSLDLGRRAAVVRWCEQEAARLEAESARDEEVERLAKVHHEAGYIAEWDALHPETRDGLVAQMRAVLDRLAADGRLLPEGGTILDGLIRTIPSEIPDDGPRTWQSLEDVPHDVTVTDCEGDELVFDGEHWQRGGRMPCVIYSPAMISNWGPFTEVVADSGPDGTPEKPWPSLNEVPGHVLAVLDVTGVRWARRSASGAWFGCDGQLRCCKGHPEVAPFVRVDGDKA